MGDVDPEAALAALSAREEQNAARRNTFARSVASYYRTLIEEGTPDGLAGALTENFHDHHWAFVFGANSGDE